MTTPTAKVEGPFSYIRTPRLTRSAPAELFGRRLSSRQRSSIARASQPDERAVPDRLYGRGYSAGTLSDRAGAVSRHHVSPEQSAPAESRAVSALSNAARRPRDVRRWGRVLGTPSKSEDGGVVAMRVPAEFRHEGVEQVRQRQRRFGTDD